jgi:hypothetical protein
MGQFGDLRRLAMFCASGLRDPSYISEVKPLSSASRHSSMRVAVVEMGDDGNIHTLGEVPEHLCKDW